MEQKIKNQVGAVDLLEYVKSTQRNWVVNGTNPKQCTQPWLTHNVSNTINVKPDEWDDVLPNFIYKYRKYFCGVCLQQLVIKKPPQKYLRYL